MGFKPPQLCHLVVLVAVMYDLLLRHQPRAQAGGPMFGTIEILDALVLSLCGLALLGNRK